METDARAPVSLLLHSMLLSFCSRLEEFGSVGATLSQALIGILTVSSRSTLRRALSVLSLIVISVGAVFAGSVVVHMAFNSQKGASIDRLEVALGKNVDLAFLTPVETSEAFEWLAWVLPTLIVVFISTVALLVTWAGPGGSAWSAARLRAGRKIRIAPGPTGVPVLGCAKVMRGNAHRTLAKLAQEHNAEKLMAFSVGCTRIVITSDSAVARDMLLGSAFAERPLKEAAEKLLFARAMGFAAPGPYWRRLRRIAATSLFCPKQIAAHQEVRQEETTRMLEAIHQASAAPSDVPAAAASSNRSVRLRSFLQRAAVNNMMRIVFGRRYEFGESVAEAEELEGMIRDCFDVLGAFNWADHFPGLRYLDTLAVGSKCRSLVPRVKVFVQRIIDEHRAKSDSELNSECDFVDVLLGLQGEDRLSDIDMISVLWEMIFRGTDTIAVLTEWALAEMTLNPEIQKKVQSELDMVVGPQRHVEDSDMAKLPYLQAVLKETLRAHPPGPLLSWARLATEDVKLGGFDVPRGTTAMVNMWAITHDPAVWKNPFEFSPDRFITGEVSDFDVRGGDLRLAPFGAGRRVCPGRSLGLATSYLWLARLLHQFSWSSDPQHPVHLHEDLKLSCEMSSPLRAIPVTRTCLFA